MTEIGRMYRVYIGKFNLYLAGSYVSQDAAEKAGVETNFDFTVENERMEIVSLKGKFERILRIPERSEKNDKNNEHYG